MVTNSIDYFLVSFLISVGMVPLIIHLSKRYNLFDRIDDRKIHEGKISRLGGIAIFIGFFIPFAIVACDIQVKFNLPLYILAMLIAFITGFVDDLWHMRAIYKLGLQVLCGFVLASSGLTINKIHIGSFLMVEFGLLSYILTIIWVVVFINAINLLDGMDGLASGIVFIANIFIVIISIIIGNTLIASMSIMMAGAILGFYVFNFPPAKIFMGDGGAYFIGFIYASLPLMGIKKAPLATIFLIPLILLLVPLGDIVQVMLKRARMGGSIFIADKNHIHHRLMQIGLSTKGINFVLYVFTTILGFTSLIMVNIQTQYSYFLFIIIFLLLLWSMFLLNSVENIIIEKEQKGENKREFFRFTSNDFIEIQPIDEVAHLTKGVSFDFSPMGISFTTQTPWKSGQVLLIDYFIPDENESIRMEVMVVWSKRIDLTLGYLTGARILEIETVQENKFITEHYFKGVKNEKNLNGNDKKKPDKKKLK